VENITSSKLFRTRQGTLVLGVVAAVLAAIALIVYLHEYRNSVSPGGAVPVLVAKSLIPKGTPGELVASSGKYQVTNIPQGSVTSGAFTDPASLSNTVSNTAIYPGQQLTDSDFVAKSSIPYAGQLSKSQRAVVIPLDSPSSVGGQISSGDSVDVYALVTPTTANAQPVAKLVLPNMYVMGLSDGNVTLRATPTQAGELIWASNNAKIWLTLRPGGGTVTKPPAVTANTLLGR
jgi:Flp pilus assembly protein CpaB